MQNKWGIPHFSKWFAVPWALDMGAERTLMASLQKRGSWTAWVPIWSFCMEFLTTYCPAHRGLQNFKCMMGLSLLYPARSYPITFVCCAAVQQEFSHGRPEDGTSSTPHHWTGWVFALSDVEWWEWERKRERENKKPAIPMSMQTCVKASESAPNSRDFTN